MTVTDHDEIDVEAYDPDLDEVGGSASGTRRRRDRTGVADRPRENRSPAAQRAIDRRRKRATQRSTTRLVGQSARAGEGVLTRLVRSPGDLLRRMPFAVLVIAILAVGLGLTLWLSTTAAQTSYQLSATRQENQTLSDRRDALKKSFELGDSAPELSDKATALGMIPASNVPRLVVASDGRTRVEGTIAPATGSAAPSMGSDTRNAVTPQPGSSTTGNTAALPATAGTPGSPAPAGGSIAANVLPGQSSGQQTTPGASASPTAPAAGSPTTSAPAASTTQTAPGSTDSSIPR